MGNYKHNLTKEELIEKLIEMRLTESMSKPSMIKYLKQDLGYGTTQAYEYYNWMNEAISEAYHSQNQNVAVEAITQLEFAMEYAKTTGNHKLWLEIRKELNKICGLYIEKSEITTKILNITPPKNE